MPIDPGFAPLLDAMAAAPPPPPDQDPIATARTAVWAVFQHASPPEVEVSDRTVDGPHGPVPVRCYGPTTGPHGTDRVPLVVYLHGGGFITGSLDTHDAICRELALATGAAVVSVGYRLTPEHTHPVPVDDCFAALVWAAGARDELGASGPLVVAGDSAGGCLSAAVAIRCRDAGGPTPALQVLVYPTVEPPGDHPSLAENDGVLLTRAGMEWMWDAYLGGDIVTTDPTAVPSRAPSLAGVAPALVITAEYDPLRDEGESYADALEACGVSVQRTRYDGMIHGFMGLFDHSDGARRAIAEIADAVRRLG